MDNVAHGLGKQVQAIETVNDQCKPLKRIPNDKVRDMLFRKGATWLPALFLLKFHPKQLVYSDLCKTYLSTRLPVEY